MRFGRRGLRDVDVDVAESAELRDRLVGVVEGLAVPAGLVLDRLDAFALDRAGDHDGRLARGAGSLRVRTVDRLDVVAVDLDRLPAERMRAVAVDVQVPADHCLAALPEAVDVDDRRQVVELVVRRVLEGLPDGALGGLAVSEEHPRAIGKPGEVLADVHQCVNKVYFPHGGIISCVVELKNGEGIETGMIGADGVFGAEGLG